MIDISDDEINIIKHARKSLLFSDDKLWTKSSSESLFDVAMGSYDGAEICEMVGLYILNKISAIFGKNRVGLYRDDGLALVKGNSTRNADMARKSLNETFHQFGLKITCEVSHHLAHFLDVTLDLNSNRFVPYRKPLNTTQYVDSRSNHPPSIIKHIPKSINTRISSLSSDQKAYDQSKPFYEEALKQSNFKETLHYNPPDLNASATPKRKRHRNVIWFNPPYSKSVKTNVGGRFLQLIDKHFPPTNPLHKIFNRNTMKISYSCMPNVKNVISRHNRKILGRSEATKPATSCNCRNQDECPLDNKCQAESIVYKAVVTSLDDGLKKEYIGMTAANSFKERYRNHKKSFNIIRYEKETELSEYIWELKFKEKAFAINWSILKHSTPYAPGSTRCNLCNEEKLSIMKADQKTLLNKRSEIFGKCRHKDRFQVGNFHRKRVRHRKSRNQTN